LPDTNDLIGDSGASAPDGPRIVPRLTTQASLDATAAGTSSQAATHVREPLVGELIVTYVMEPAGVGQSLTHQHLHQLDVAEDGLRDLALANLTNELSEIQLGEHSHLMLVQTGGEREACTLLLEGLWDQLAANLDGDPAVGVPSQDMVLIADTASAEALAELRRAVPQLHDPDAANALSAQLFVWREEKWHILGSEY